MTSPSAIRSWSPVADGLGIALRELSHARTHCGGPRHRPHAKFGDPGTPGSPLATGTPSHPNGRQPCPSRGPPTVAYPRSRARMERPGSYGACRVPQPSTSALPGKDRVRALTLADVKPYSSSPLRLAGRASVRAATPDTTPRVDRRTCGVRPHSATVSPGPSTPEASTVPTLCSRAGWRRASATGALDLAGSVRRRTVWHAIRRGPMELDVHATLLAVCRLPPDDCIPGWVDLASQPLVSITRTDSELSIVLP